VERFLKATLKGWRYAIENSDKVADMIVRYDPSADRDYQKKQMEAQIPLIHTGETPIGWMDRSVWGEMQATFTEARIGAMKRIEKIAKQAAKQVGDYIRDHPNMTVQDLQNDPSFREIAIQQVGETGYTGIADSKTGLHYFHPERELENKATHEVFKETFPELWAIFNQAIGETCEEASGFYLWETEGKLWEKYMYVACIDAQTADGKSLLLGAGTYLADYAVPFSTKEIDLDQVVDMQFLKEIYGQTE
jgi:hypothetical protein